MAQRSVGFETMSAGESVARRAMRAGPWPRGLRVIVWRGREAETLPESRSVSTTVAV
ncbi:MAG: hypothetical protein Q9Q40_01495 [Acidobacteriota bacterium]|nr:hypothetical protein [Acidobacteriota bacterium]